MTIKYKSIRVQEPTHEMLITLRDEQSVKTGSNVSMDQAIAKVVKRAYVRSRPKGAKK